MRARRRLLGACAVAGGLLLSGCGVIHSGDLNFRVDERLEFLSPTDRATVRQPVTVTWKIRDFTIAAPGSQAPRADAGYFAIFVDKTPIRPGKSLASIADGDPACTHDKQCVDAEYLRAHQVYTTTATSFRLPQVAQIVGSNQSNPLHSITVVLLDTTGRRIGESAWELDLRIPRAGSV